MKTEEIIKSLQELSAEDLDRVETAIWEQQAAIIAEERIRAMEEGRTKGLTREQVFKPIRRKIEAARERELQEDQLETARESSEPLKHGS